MFREQGGLPKRQKSKIIVFILILWFSALILIAAVHIKESSLASTLSGADILLLDPGHGGIDGGAQSADGTPEKDINLDIAEKIRKLAERDGWRVVMTRSSDELLGETQGSIRSKKTADLKERKRIIDETKPLLSVSIHLNSFKEDRSVRGAQVFYPHFNEQNEAADAEGALNPYGQSKLLAETIQACLKENIQDGTERVALGKRDMLIFKDITGPIVLVECGFLSNYDEAQKLKNDEYRRLMAKSIYDGIMRHTKKEP